MNFCIAVLDCNAGQSFGEKGLRNLLPLRVGGACRRSGVLSLYPTRSGSYRRELVGPHWDNASIDDIVIAELGADEISLALAPVEHISVQNQLPMRIRRIETVNRVCVCELEGAVNLLAQVSPKAAQEFGLRPGMSVWAMWKANAFRYLGKEAQSDRENNDHDSPHPASRCRGRAFDGARSCPV